MLNSCFKIIPLLIIGFVVATNAEAKKTENIIACPKIKSIHEAALLMKSVECDTKSCSVSTNKHFYENGTYWQLYVRTKALPEKEAIMHAQSFAEGVTVMFSDLAMGGLCIYYVGSSDQSSDEMIGMVAWGSDSKQKIKYKGESI